MATAYSIKPRPFVLEEDRDKPEEEQTVFQLKGLTQDEWDAVIPLIGGKNADSITLLGSTASKICRYTLGGWDNLKDEEGEIVPFSKKMKDNLNHLSAGQRMEIAVEALNRNQLNKEDEKN